MKKTLSAIIPVRGNEPYLKQTIRNIRAKAGCKIEIIVVYDGNEPDDTVDADQSIPIKTAKGVGYARHHGIKAAAGSIIFLTDSHMDFSGGFGKRIQEWHSQKKNAKDITCGCCVPMQDVRGKLLWNGAERCTAARFTLTSDESGAEHWVMSGKWAQQETGKPVGCISGACYAFTKKWYRTIGEPLKLLTGWGMDEEYLSAASWLAGGRCILLNYDAAHLFRARPSFSTSRIDAHYRWLNRIRFVEMLPATEDIKHRLSVWLALNPALCDSELSRMIESDNSRQEVQAAIKLWQSWDWTRLVPHIDDHAKPLEQRQIEAERRRNEPNQKKPSVRRIQQRPIFQCPKCLKYNTFRQRHTRNASGENRQYGRCSSCGHRGIKVTRDSIEVIRWNS